MFSLSTILVGIAAIAYVSKPDIRMKLGEQPKCFPSGRFVRGWYESPYYKTWVTDTIEPPSMILFEGTYPRYELFKEDFDKLCTGKDLRLLGRQL